MPVPHALDVPVHLFRRFLSNRFIFLLLISFFLGTDVAMPPPPPLPPPPPPIGIRRDFSFSQ
jgi:hypothetical protein